MYPPLSYRTVLLPYSSPPLPWTMGNLWCFTLYSFPRVPFYESFWSSRKRWWALEHFTNTSSSCSHDNIRCWCPILKMGNQGLENWVNSPGHTTGKGRTRARQPTETTPGPALLAPVPKMNAMTISPLTPNEKTWRCCDFLLFSLIHFMGLKF